MEFHYNKEICYFFSEILPFLSFFIEDCHAINYYVLFAFSCDLDDLSCHCWALKRGRKGLRWCGFALFLVRFCGNFYFNSQYCSFKTRGGLRLSQPLGRGFRSDMSVCDDDTGNNGRHLVVYIWPLTALLWRNILLLRSFPSIALRIPTAHNFTRH